ncbi:MAG: hypothetical protein COA68_12425 [Oceanobacter sp.]|nr:MAG: hypothetical protein COA68_12425 [Oceanobacter sp.]
MKKFPLLAVLAEVGLEQIWNEVITRGMLRCLGKRCTSVLILATLTTLADILLEGICNKTVANHLFSF